MANARFAQNYTVNWGAIQGVYGAGSDGDNLIAAVDHGVIRQGMAAALGAAQTPPPTAAVGWNIGVAPIAPSIRASLPPRISRTLEPTLVGHASASDHASGGHTAADVASDVLQAGIAGGMAYSNRAGLGKAATSFAGRIGQAAKTVGRAANATFQFAKNAGSWIARGVEAAAPEIEMAAMAL